MVAHLDRFVRGQERAKRDLALAFHDHYLSLAAAQRPDLAGAGGRARQHVLVLGPTGCGKTLLVRTLCEWLGLPVAFWSATSITETGYVGDDVDEPLKHLWRDAHGDAARAQRGVVVLDEIDKIRTAAEATRDVSGEGVQNGLLTLLDGRVANLRDKQESLGTLDTSRLLYVCMGAFTGLPRLVRQRLRGDGTLGFGGTRGGGRVSDDEAYAAATSDDLVRFGMVPEFVARFPNVTAVHALSEDDLVAVLAESEDSALERERRLWALHGIELRVQEDALRALARQALQRGTGARGLAFALRRSLAGLAWQRSAMSDDGVTRVTVHRAALVDGAPPQLERGVRAAGESLADRLRAVALGGAPRSARHGDAPAPRRNRRHDANQQSLGVGPQAPGDAPRPPGPPADRAAMGKRLLELRLHRLRWAQARREARAWWDRFEAERPLEVVLGVAEDLAERRATLQEFWEACRTSGTQGVRANVRWLDFVRERHAHEKARDLRHLLDTRDRRDGHDADGSVPGQAIAAIDAASFPAPAEDPAA
jgi:ATP-dependent Clp protease ATP-binding subunit ClpX